MPHEQGCHWASFVTKWSHPRRISHCLPSHLFNFHVTSSPQLLYVSFPSWQHKSLHNFQFPPKSSLVILVILLNVSYVSNRCFFYALKSKHNKFQHIAGAGVLCYFSAPRVSTIETQLWWSVRAPREPPGGPEHMFVNDQLQRPQ